MAVEYPRKWRPSLAMIVVGMLLFVLSLPLSGLLFFRFYDGQLVRETESELIAQGAVLSAIMAQELAARNAGPSDFGVEAPVEKKPGDQGVFRPVIPRLDLFSDGIEPLRPEARAPATPAHTIYSAIGERMSNLLRETQRRTLAGFRILDPSGVVVAGGGEIGLSLAHVDEVERSLAGHYASAVRKRFSDNPVPPLQSISRSARIRVFVALPVLIENRVAGVIYMSRTPENIIRVLYQQRRKVFMAAVIVLGFAAAIALVMVRAFKGPIDELTARTNALSTGDKRALRPLSRHGSREFAALAENVLAMSDKLFDRADYIKTFAAHVSHELKSPLTAIHGAAELLHDQGDTMTREERARFLTNVMADTERLSALLGRLRELAVADNPSIDGMCTVDDLMTELKEIFDRPHITCLGDTLETIKISRENAMIVFSHLADNAEKHGAKRLSIDVRKNGDMVSFTVNDDGVGVSAANAEKIFDLFFTTRRDNGGTGMGLVIVEALLKAHKGSIALQEGREKGACFVVEIPATI